MGGWGDEEDGRPSIRTKAELENALRQADEVERLARAALASGTFALTVDTVKVLNALAIEGLTEDPPGEFRTTNKVRPISGSNHQPPPFDQVPGLVRSMCGYINDLPPIRTTRESPRSEVQAMVDRGIHVASYALWRLNWIHPFEDGNGRTSRAISHLLLCFHSQMILPGKSLPERIAGDKRKFYNCLDACDQAHKRKKRIRIQQLEGFVHRHFTAQIDEFLEARGK